MYDTARRVALVKQRVRENTRRRQRCGIYGLSAACMLLREDAGGYVLVAVVSFAAAVVITALCFRLRIRENQKKGGADKPNRHEQEEKSQ